MKANQVAKWRKERGVCRHCGGPVPCWSAPGDYAVGRKHTKGTHAQMTEAKRQEAPNA